RAVAHGPTCHTGRTSCFGQPETPTLGEVLGELFGVIEARRGERPAGSYTVELLDAG
ncbi:MAG: bifunctional phosphoribosyl-AMP cyclohydrolase/phosphoribosyl-ATP diphosphatase, partial [Actinobacteria bacterium]|nr:bifunctional phosphoribosyl-AMP cyclohydrolase/phosphoribosyl-ATP diphosphatase [Actinomycetota bacterium]NIT95187.1 bifunctional phosphoribosyl-AMP cyclohydrolase/phosphoribosyl-ATP diphosphatase [Actinomycetota bacterium]NIU18862.1 bifunctional phosphoribosyl-AMP cyclohydrolase/phosphoribosyl-ATP diphosphatase [Actinomycetota bacterium]NIU65831.1 bifunctional phosphoribosyl-AMP cyclohydrolase/phosphoribosyl-ATP diphosphatase [Actinomycetota bacterium]NIV55343.1 bifunctional phosphoribosyl-